VTDRSVADAVRVEALEWLGPKTRAHPQPPKWAMIVLGVAFLIDVFAHGIDVMEPVALVAAIAMGSWAEDQLYLLSCKRSTFMQVVTTALMIPGSFFGGIIATAITAEMFKLEMLASACFLAGLWMASSAGGTLVVLVVDLVGRRATSRFAARIQLTVLGVVAVWATVAGTIALVVPRVIAHELSDKPDGFHVNFGDKNMTGSEFKTWFESSDLPAFVKAIGPADLISLAFVTLALVLLLPAVISAAGKLGALAMERIHPMDQAMARVAAGDLMVRVEEGGNEELKRLAVRFNAMVGALDLARRLENAFGAYVSRPVLARIRAQHGALDIPAISREATVFFADVRGYTAISERLSPEQILGLLRHYYKEALDVVAAHEGYVDKFIGDAIYVVFNGPLDQDDHVSRSARCALALIEKVAELNAAGTFEHVDKLQIGIGMATGPVIAGNLGSSHSTQFSVIGDTVNLAARLSGHAPAGEVWMNEACALALPADLAAEPMTPLNLKGKAKAIVPHRLGRSAVRGADA